MEFNLARRRLAGALVLSCLALASVGCGSGDVSSATISAISEDPANPGDPGFTDDRDFIDYSRAVGFYSDGSVSGSTKFPDAGPGFVKIFRLRNRGYGTATLIRTIQIAAANFRAEYPSGDRLQIGDTSDSNGGYISGHASHQNGLDLDAAYLNTQHVERDPNTNGPGGYKEQFVRNGKLTSNFDVARNWSVLKHIVLRGNTSRIFVDPAIKKAMCSQALLDGSVSTAERTEVLRRLRPYKNHADHFHLRLKCPPNHPRCKDQSEVSKSSGCSYANEILTDEQRSDDELGPDDDSFSEPDAT